MQDVHLIDVVVLGIELLPALAFGLAGERVGRAIAKWPRMVRVLTPGLLVIPYVVLAVWYHLLRWEWCAVYAGLPVLMAWLMAQAAKADAEQRGNWRDALILLGLGLAVDLRWFDTAWPAGMRGLGNLLLVDAGLYAFLGIRCLSGAGFDFHFRGNDCKTGLRELAFFAPVVVALGLAVGFIHPHASVSGFSRVWRILSPLGRAMISWVGIFVFVAVPEELFFRAWVQNFLERRLGRGAALIVASVLFGLSHFNKRNPAGAVFNWRYVLLATIAGIFYGRAWREQRRVPASGITHTCVDWIWYLWF
jgi:membrane protease YdiL (CAAX protease family)